MNTQPMNTPPDTWHEMPVTSFPALVQFQDGECRIYYRFYGDATKVVRWRPWVDPELPKPDAFKQYCIDNGFSPSGLAEPRYRACWKAAESYGRAAERSRFAEGVEKALNRFQFAKDYGSAQLLADLGALAKGTNL